MRWFLFTLGLVFDHAVFGAEATLKSYGTSSQASPKTSIPHSKPHQDSIEVSNIPLPPSGVHREALMGDMPYSSLSLSKAGDVWLSGKNHLWKWNPEKGILKKIEIPSEGFGKLTSWGAEGVLYQSSKKVYLVLDQPLSIKEIYSGSQVALDLDSEGAIAIGSKQSYLIEEDLLKKTPLHLDLSHCEDISLGTGDQVFCRIKNEIFLARKSQKKMKPMLKSKSPIKDFRAVGESIVVVSDKAVWLVASDARLIKTIVPENGRRIAGSHLEKDHHAFLFSDRLFEVNPMDGKSKINTWISAPAAKVVEDLCYNNGRIGMILDGFPYLFQIEKSLK